jgi:hypothetical protein
MNQYIIKVGLRYDTSYTCYITAESCVDAIIEAVTQARDSAAKCNLLADIVSVTVEN